MSKTIKVTYNSGTPETSITIDGIPFDTSRIKGMEIADWAYPFMIRKVRWNGFYDEMVEASGGEKVFNLIFEGSESDLNELKEAWADAPVTVVTEENAGNIAVIVYDENSLTTDITVNGRTFDTSRINGREIADWIYPFMIRKVKWNGIFEELSEFTGSAEYTIQFSGSNSAMQELIGECPETVSIVRNRKPEENVSFTFLSLSREIFLAFFADIDNPKLPDSIISEIRKSLCNPEPVFPVYVKAVTEVAGVEGKDTPCKASSMEELIECISGIYNSWDSPRANVYRRDHDIGWNSGFVIEISRSGEADDKEARKRKFYDKYGNFFPQYIERSAYNENVVEDLYKLGLWYREVELDDNKADFQFRKSEFMKKYRDILVRGIGGCENLKEVAYFYYVKGLWHRDFTGWKRKSQKFFMMSYVLEISLGNETPEAESEIVFDGNSLRQIAKMFQYGSEYSSPDYEKALEFYRKTDGLYGVENIEAVVCCEKCGEYAFIIEDYENALYYFLLAEDYYQEYISHCYDMIADAEDDDDVDFWNDIIESYSSSIAFNYYRISECYEQIEDEDNQFLYLSMSVEKDDTFEVAQCSLGVCYCCGTGTPADMEKAVHCFYKSAEKNYPQAYYYLGMCYEKGAGVETDIQRARAIYEAGAELGSEICAEKLEELDSRNRNKSGRNPLKRGLKTGAKIVSGILSGATEGLISAIMDEDDI